jgi:hypothetical protein
MFRARPVRALAVASVMMLVLSACGDDDGGLVDLGSNQGTTNSQGSGGENDGDSATTTTTQPPIESAFDFIDQFDFDDGPAVGAISVGPTDVAAAAAIAAEMTAGGIELTGLEFWVFDVVDSDERLLVLEADASAGEASSDPTEGDFFGILRSSPTVAEAGLTRLVVNYRDSDAEGDYVLTMTIPMQELLALDDDGDITPFTQVQITRG